MFPSTSPASTGILPSVASLSTSLLSHSTSNTSLLHSSSTKKHKHKKHNKHRRKHKHKHKHRERDSDGPTHGDDSHGSDEDASSSSEEAEKAMNNSASAVQLPSAATHAHDTPSLRSPTKVTLTHKHPSSLQHSQSLPALTPQQNMEQQLHSYLQGSNANSSNLYSSAHW